MLPPCTTRNSTVDAAEFLRGDQWPARLQSDLQSRCADWVFQNPLVRNFVKTSNARSLHLNFRLFAATCRSEVRHILAGSLDEWPVGRAVKKQLYPEESRNHITMFNSSARSRVMKLFGARDPKEKSTLALARMLSQYDMSSMPFENALAESKRRDQPRPITVGTMVVPMAAKQTAATADFSLAQPMVTCDLRREGIGIFTTRRQEVPAFIVALADSEDSWKFFTCELRHQSRRPGGWWHLGLLVQNLYDPDIGQMQDFRARLKQVFGETGQTAAAVEPDHW